VVVSPPTNKIDTLQGNITSDLMLDVNTHYILNGQVYVKNNATLTIPAGITVSVVKSDVRENKGVLVITKGSKLFINGTLDKPVVFTSAATTKSPGDWGAIILLGKAPTNIGTGNIAGLVVSADTEFGGTVSDDNSGSIKYLRLEYCGGINPDNEDEWLVDKASGLCLESVGSATTIDNVMVEHSNDDAFQFVGGTVNATHLIGYNNGDDDFDFDLGYTGKLQYLISYRTELTSTHALRANGIESYNDEVPTANLPLTRPVISNITIIGPQGMETVKTNLNQGVYIRKGTSFVVQNSIIAEYPQGGLMVCNKTRPVLLNDAGSEFKYNLVHSDSASRTFSWDKGYAVVGDTVLRDFALNTVNNNTLIQQSADLKLKAMYAVNGPDLTPGDGSVALTGANFVGADFATFFTPVTYRGAIGSTNWAASGNWVVWK
jgi:hypothetical protein